MARPKSTPQESIYKPLVQVEGDVHPFEKLDKEGEPPTLVSVGYSKVGPSNRDYFSYTVTTRGREVLSVVVSEGDQRPIVSDQAKIEFQTVIDEKEM